MSGRMRGGFAFVAALAAIFALAAAPASGKPKGGKKRVKLNAVERADAPGELAIKVRSRWRSRVVIEERAEDGWRRIARGRPNKKRRLRLTAAAPTGTDRVVLRARVPKRRAVSRRVKIALQPASQPEPEPPVAVPVPQDVPVGFNNNAVSQRAATPEQSADLLAAVGADIDRVQINWERFEPVPGVYDFLLSDAIYEADLARGVRPLFILAYAPRWASGSACNGVGGRCHAGPTPDHYDDFARAAAALAARYPEAAGIEIWNEPNLVFFWRPAPDPEGYAALLRESFTAIRKADPSMPVAGGSVGQLHPAPSVPAPEFMRRVYAAGAANAMDALAVHSYPGGDPTAERAITDVADLRATRDALGNPTTPLWVTETGASTTGIGALGELDQAARLTLLDTRLRAAPDVQMVLFHTLIDPKVDPASIEAGYGVVRSDLSKKPSYCALALAWAGSASC